MMTPARGKVWGDLGVWFWVLGIVGIPIAGVMAKVLSQGAEPWLWFWRQEHTQSALFNTIKLGVMAILINGAMGLLLAWRLVNVRGKWAAVLKSLVDLPFSISPVIVGLMLIVAYGGRSRMGMWLESVGAQIVFAWPGMLLATLIVTLPFVAREVTPVLKAHGLDQEESGLILGASRWRVFWHITLPSIRWGLLFGLSLTFARSIGEFGAVAVVSGSLEGRTETATIRIHSLFNDFMYVEAMVGSMVLILISTAAIKMVQWCSKKHVKRMRK